MTAVSELELPVFDYADAGLHGERFHETMRQLREQHWLATSPMGWLFVLDRDSAATFLRSRTVEFPSRAVS